MAHPRPSLSVFGRQLLVTRVAGWLAGGARRRAARHQPGDRVQVGPPVPGRGRRPGLLDRSSRPHRSPRRLRRHASRPDPRRPGRAGGTGPTASARCSGCRPRPSTGCSPGAASAACAMPTGSRPRRSATSPATRARSSTRTTRSSAASPTAAAGGCSAAQATGSRARAASGTTTSRSSSTTPAGYAVVVPVPDETARQRGRAPSRSRPPSSPSLGIRIERVLTDNGAGLHAAVPIATPLDRLGARHKRDPALPTADQRQGRALHPDPAQRVGLRPAVPIERRARRPPSRCSSTSTIAGGPTRRSAGGHPSTLSTTSLGITPRRRRGPLSPSSPATTEPAHRRRCAGRRGRSPTRASPPRRS